MSLHARTAEQLYDPPAAWESISRLVAAVSIPVLGNGDVFEVRRPTPLPATRLRYPRPDVQRSASYQHQQHWGALACTSSAVQWVISLRPV